MIWTVRTAVTTWNPTVLHFHPLKYSWIPTVGSICWVTTFCLMIYQEDGRTISLSSTESTNQIGSNSLTNSEFWLVLPRIPVTFVGCIPMPISKCLQCHIFQQLDLKSKIIQLPKKSYRFAKFLVPFWWNHQQLTWIHLSMIMVSTFQWFQPSKAHGFGHPSRQQLLSHGAAW